MSDCRFGVLPVNYLAVYFSKMVAKRVGSTEGYSHKLICNTCFKTVQQCVTYQLSLVLTLLQAETYNSYYNNNTEHLHNRDSEESQNDFCNP